MNVEINYQHWQLVQDDNNIAWLTFDKADARFNTIDDVVLDELQKTLETLQSNTHPKGLVIQSGKKTDFITGVDVEQFRKMNYGTSELDLLQKGQQVFKMLENLSFPTVALIKGSCLGEGLELALACRYRIAEDQSKTRLGLPEIKLGLHPGCGGTVRLPRLIGSLRAFNLILSGRTIGAVVAHKMGVVDFALPSRHLQAAVIHCIKQQPPRYKPTGIHHLSNIDGLRSVFEKSIRKKLLHKIKASHYPAPFAVLNNWLEYGIKGENAFVAEVDSFRQIMFTNTAKNLIRTFF